MLVVSVSLQIDAQPFAAVQQSFVTAHVVIAYGVPNVPRADREWDSLRLLPAEVLFHQDTRLQKTNELNGLGWHLSGIDAHLGNILDRRQLAVAQAPFKRHPIQRIVDAVELQERCAWAEVQQSTDLRGCCRDLDTFRGVAKQNTMLSERAQQYGRGSSAARKVSPANCDRASMICSTI